MRFAARSGRGAHWVLALAGLFLSLLTRGAELPEARVAVALSDAGGAYAEVAQSLREGLIAAGRYRVDVVVAGEESSDFAARLDGSHAVVVVTVGMRAASAVQQMGLSTPVLFTLVPRTALERLLSTSKGNGQRAGIYLDQPPERQLELVKLIIPAATRLGVLYGPDSAAGANALEAAAAQLGLKIEAENVSDSAQVAPALQRVLERSEVLLGLPDPEVFNKNTVHNVLLTAYRAGDAVFAFSPAYVKAGALAGVFSSSAQVGTQAAEAVIAWVNKQPLPPLQQPKYFSVTVNRTVARSMGIPIEDDRQLQQKLQKSAVRETAEASP
jgi:putative tryptophan/tyrosine transport system substrate-binding protein